MDFVQERTADDRPFRVLVVLDVHTRECLAIEMNRCAVHRPRIAVEERDR